MRVTPDEIPPLMVRFINRTEGLAALEIYEAGGSPRAGELRERLTGGDDVTG